MNKNALLLASLITALTGCGADVGGGQSLGNVTSGTEEPGTEPEPTLDRSFASCNSVTKTCILSGVINEDYRLDPSFKWVIQGFTFVGAGNRVIADDADAQQVKNAGVTLTVPAGMHVRALADASLVVTRGSMLMAEGTSTNPITFSSIDNDFDGQGEWGGLVIQGFAPQYGLGDTGVCHGTGTICNVAGEGGAEIGRFGGSDPADNSGVLRYVHIAEAGKVAGPDNEVNALTLQAVGHGTTLEYIQVHGCQDDAIEWFGGTANLKYAILTNNDDDDLDYDEGFQGNIQHVFIRKHPTKSGPTGTNDPRGIEANSNLSQTRQVPQTRAALSNITIIGSAVSNAGAGQPGIMLRGQVTTEFNNIAVSNFTLACMQAASSEQATVTLNNGLCDSATSVRSNPVVISGNGFANINPASMTFDSVGAITQPQAILGLLTAPTAVDNGSGFAFDATNYIGAVDPNTGNLSRDWWSSWALPNTMTNLPAAL